MGAVTVDVDEVICHLTTFWLLAPAVGLKLLDRWLFVFKLSWSTPEHINYELAASWLPVPPVR